MHKKMLPMDAAAACEPCPKTNGLKFEKTINLGHGYEIKAGNAEDLGDFSTYSLLALFYKQKMIFLASSDDEYEFDHSQYPILHPINDSITEILVEVNDRPSRNYLKYFKVASGHVVETKTLPLFFGKAARLAENEQLYYAGIRDDGEVVDTNVMVYQPILYYKITNQGILLDSALTVKKNAYIYGRFMGYEYDSDKTVPVNGRLEDEIKRIDKAVE